MVCIRRGLFWMGALATASLIASGAGAAECVKEYTWKCADKNPNSCKGTFHAGSAETFTESNACPTNGAPHELWQVLRFSGLPKGTHKVRTSYASQDVCIGDSFGETVQIRARQAAGCDETGLFQSIQTLDDSCCSTEADYNLGMSGTTDICLGFESSKAYAGDPPPCSPNCYGQDEFYMFHGSISAPAIVTTLDTLYPPDGETTNPGTIFSGNYTKLKDCDNDYEVLQEGGTNHRLFHVYTIEKVPAGSSQTLKVEGYRPNNSDGDNFAILYQWTTAATCPTSGPYQTSGITINSASETTYSANVGNSSGRLCVAVDDTTGGSNNDKVYIDCLYVEVANPACP